jgi:pyruvate/2-oxoglutarate dehydrogenase complex dihydrolipoamide acyltransferase (E2) component
VRRRNVSSHIETLDEGQTVESGGFIELSEEQESLPRNKELIEEGLLIEVDEGEGPTEPAEQLAKEKGVDLAQVSGTGSGGSITKSDVEKYINEQEGGS